MSGLGGRLIVVLKNKIVSIFFVLFVPCLGVGDRTSANTIAEDLYVAQSGIKIMTGGFRAGRHLRERFFPGIINKCINHEIKKIKTEEELKECLVAHVFVSKGSDELPCECNKVVEVFTRLAGLEAMESIREEFVQASNKVAALKAAEKSKSTAGMSTTKKVLIGGAVIVVGGIVFILAAPILFPDTEFAKKVTDMFKNGKEVAVTAKGAVEGAAAAKVTTQATVVAVAGAASASSQNKKESNDEVSDNRLLPTFNEVGAFVAAMPLAEKLAVVTVVIDAVELAQPYVFPTPEEKLDYLLTKRKNQLSLFERMQKAHLHKLPDSQG